MRSPRHEFAGYVAVSAGMAVAASCYAMLGQLLSHAAGGWLLVAIVTAGALCLAVSGSVAELASMFPSAPGIRTYLRAGFGDEFSLAMTIAVLFMVVLFAGIETHVVMVTLGPLVPGLPESVGAVLVLVAIIAVNLSGLEPPRIVQDVATYTLIALSVAISAYALLVAPTSPVIPAVAGSPPRFFAAVGAAIFFFMGFEWVTQVGRSPRAYERMVPWAMVVALAVLIVTYGLFAAATQAHVAVARLGFSLPAHLALGQVLFGRTGVWLMAGMSMLAMVTTFNAGLMGASRLTYAVAREGLLPAPLARISVRTGVPVAAIVFVGGLGVVAALVELRMGLHVPASIICAAIACFEYGAFMWAALRLRATRPDTRRAFRTPVPAALQWAVALVMPALGLASLAAEREWVVACCSGFVMVGVTSLFLARALCARRPRDVRAVAPVALRAETP